MTILDTRNDNPWHNAWQSVTRDMTILDAIHDNPWHKTWQSLTKNMKIREHKTTKLVLPKIDINRNWDLFPSYMNILKYPSIHHMRYFCLSVCLTSSKQLTPSLCVFHIILLPSFIPPPTFVLITCFRFRSSWICYVSNLKILKL